MTNISRLQHSHIPTNVNIESNYEYSLYPADDNANDDLPTDNNNIGHNQHTHQTNGNDTSGAASILSDMFEEVYSHYGTNSAIHQQCQQ